MTEMENETKKKLCEIIKNYLDEHHNEHHIYEYTQHENDQFVCRVSGIVGSPFVELYLNITVYDTCVVSECILPIHAAPEVYADVAEYFMRINNISTKGSLLLDYDSGVMRHEICFDSAMLLYSDEDREFAIPYLLCIGQMLLHRIGATLTAILFGGKNGKTIKELFELPFADSEEEESGDSEEEEKE
jgi:hypothetical protein